MVFDIKDFICMFLFCKTLTIFRTCTGAVFCYSWNVKNKFVTFTLWYLFMEWHMNIMGSVYYHCKLDLNTKLCVASVISSDVFYYASCKTEFACISVSRSTDVWKVYE